MNQRKEAAEKTKMSIVRAGARLFRQRGVEDVTVSDITRAAGVTRTSFYAHFRSKDELIMMFLSDLDAEYVRYYESTLCAEEASTLSPLIKLEMLLKQSNRIITSPGADLLRYYYTLMLRNPRQQLVKRYYDGLIRTLIAECRENGLLSEHCSDQDIFLSCLALNRGSCMDWVLSGGDVPIENWDVPLHNLCVGISAAAEKGV